MQDIVLDAIRGQAIPGVTHQYNVQRKTVGLCVFYREENSQKPPGFLLSVGTSPSANHRKLLE